MPSPWLKDRFEIRWKGSWSKIRNLFRRGSRAAPTRGPAPLTPQPPHSLIAMLKGPINHQNGSPLFAILPPEIRNRIFALALMSYDDATRPYPQTAYYYRPGYHYPHRIDTALLATCRRIYSETHDLPLSLNEHVFWCSADRGPPGVWFRDYPVLYFELMTIDQRKAIVDVHFFSQLFWLETTFPYACTQINAKRLKITVRHTDWWYWENNVPLVVTSGWGNNLRAIKELEELVVELETMERDKDQLEAIVKIMNTWQFDLNGGRKLTTQGNQIRRERYIGQRSFLHHNDTFGLTYNPDLDSWVYDLVLLAGQLPYVVSTLRWTAKKSE